jgi:hypothetical protein
LETSNIKRLKELGHKNSKLKVSMPTWHWRMRPLKDVPTTELNGLLSGG